MRRSDNLTDAERGRLTALTANEARRLTGVPGFQVDVHKDGVCVDSQAVYSDDEWKARTMAMMLTTVSFAGEMVSYEVRSLS